MNLGYKQEEFAIAQARLVVFAYVRLGYRLRGKHWKRCNDCPVGKKYSVHKDSLAIDFVITINGEIISDDGPYNKLHDAWDEIGGAPRIVGDLGHFSFAWGGRW